MSEFSCTITIGEKPDLEKLRQEIIDNFLAPLARLIDEHDVGRLHWNVHNDYNCKLMVHFYERKDGRVGTNYYGSLHNDLSVVVNVVGGMGNHPDKRFSLKEFLMHLAEIYRKLFAELAERYAEVAAISTVIQGTMARLRSIKATAHYE